MNKLEEFILKLQQGDVKTISRAITLVENELSGYDEVLKKLQRNKQTTIVGITGPPGAGKSTLVNSLISEIVSKGLRVAVLAVDPTSPFNYGSLLGDRIRMSKHYLNDRVYIRSLASRGSLGGLSAKIIEVSDVVAASNFDYLIVETVGVGQSEVEVAGLAETTVVVLVPEAGDEIQGIKSGLMEIADLFVVNKSDRAGADIFANNLRKMVHERRAGTWTVPVLQCISSSDVGIKELLDKIDAHKGMFNNERRRYFMAEKIYHLIMEHRMKPFSRKQILEHLSGIENLEEVNIYQQCEEMLKQ